ncbi:putative reverse transcriptase domain-containing protein [Tanacetum coccineum]
MKGDDITVYTNHFHELAVMCPTMVTPEYKKIEHYILGLPKRIQGNVAFSKFATAREAILMAHNLMDQVVKEGVILKTNHYATDASCIILVIAQLSVEYTKRELQQEPNVVTGTFPLNNHYASILFDSGANKSFVSTTFSTLIDIAPSTLDTSYDVELANRKTDEKKLIDIPIVRDFPEVFPEDLSGLPPTREVEFRIDLIPGVMLVIAKPLTLLNQKNKKFEWGDKQEEAFWTQKEKLCNALVLALPDRPDDFMGYYDASKQGFGCVLMHRGKVIAYASRQLKFERRNDVGLYFMDQIWNPSSSNVRTLIMDEAHTSKYSVHLGADKMYYVARNEKGHRTIR